MFKQLQLIILTLFYYRADLKLYNKELKLFYKIIKIAQGRFVKNRENLFLDAFLILSNKAKCDLRGCYLLWLRGLYGSAFCLVESLRRTSNMMAVLHTKPELIQVYLDEEKNQYREDKEFKNCFSESSLNKIVNDHFGEKKGQYSKYANLDKALHGGAVGARTFYGMIHRDKEGKKSVTLTFSPFFETEKANAILGISSAVILDIVGIFLERNINDEEIKKNLDNYHRLLKECNKNFLKKMYFQDFKEGYLRKNC